MGLASSGTLLPVLTIRHRFGVVHLRYRSKESGGSSNGALPLASAGSVGPHTYARKKTYAAYVFYINVFAYVCKCFFKVRKSYHIAALLTSVATWVVSAMPSIPHSRQAASSLIHGETNFMTHFFVSVMNSLLSQAWISFQSRKVPFVQY